ncbi:unnamed protein product [Prorocentrum cordatum]|uniref:Pentatricopeptide repeat-containing protein, chloroplastic n=1 Tax=Prorocentrum cordatum TaxID=2364126 RepID=A0ABN9TY48_9DINO|nr:unnamed protein product [Polarella glacialis]
MDRGAAPVAPVHRIPPTTCKSKPRPGHATIRAFGKATQWQQALSVLRVMVLAKVVVNVFSYSAGISACEKGKQWQLALGLLSEMCEATVEPDIFSYSAGISACEKGERWQPALALLIEQALAAGSWAAQRDV